MMLVKPGAKFNDARDLLKSCDFTIRDAFESEGDERRLAEHYAEHAGRPYYDALIRYMMSGPIFAIRLSVHPAAVFSGPPDIEKRSLIALRSAVHQYRQRNGAEGPRNFFHCSDSLVSKAREDQIWFG